ncbi:D-glycero-alpha-D-manno-heptose-1, 7-bisphosphate 7-phosphatase (modular protein) [Candidatus Zixiibacteriota bacterium]|nr:D-glycero-alpha-D-manno-heptose-1, 7-bisphosphate 7-phosphatase (modular protein) [candidate division Zixibacteria bacterium]
MKRILAIRLGAIGDVILTSPALLNLKLSFPDAVIYFLTRPKTAGIAKRFAGVDEIIEFPQKGNLIDLFKYGEFLDSSGFDYAVDFHGNIRSKYMMRHISAPVKVQYDKRRWERIRSISPRRIKGIRDDSPHTIDLYNAAVAKCGGKIFATRPILALDKDITVSRLFDNDAPTIAIAPGASYPPKKWPAERFIGFMQAAFDRLDANILLILSYQDKEIANIKSSIPLNRLRIRIDADLTELAGIISGSDLLLCNDSGLAHLGSAVGTPVMALFGPTHPTLGFAPRGLRDAVIQVDEFCRPCSLHGKTPCFREEQFCFTRIGVDDVVARAESMLRENAKGEKALFIDRDGTLIKEKDFIKNVTDIEPEAGSVEAIKAARAAGFKIIVLSNQSGVARGYFTEETVKIINRRISEIYRAAGAEIDDFFYCPHLPKGEIEEYAVECQCRKPHPGMVEEACRKHNINPFRAYVIGDKLSDTNLAAVIGGKGILVRTGYGVGEEEQLGKLKLPAPVTVAENLFDAVKYILEKRIV